MFFGFFWFFSIFLLVALFLFYFHFISSGLFCLSWIIFSLSFIFAWDLIIFFSWLPVNNVIVFFVSLMTFPFIPRRVLLLALTTSTCLPISCASAIILLLKLCFGRILVLPIHP